MKKRLAALILALLFLFCGCREQSAEEPVQGDSDKTEENLPVMQEQSENKPLIFACGRKFAEIHPAKRSGASGALVPLLYDSLIELNNTYHINRNYKDHLDGGLASEIEQDGLTYTITLHDTVFSDGSEVRAADVANSLAAAMEEGSLWQQRLSIVSDCTVLTGKMIRITITEARQDFIALLTFPVTKALNNGDFLGSGQYMLSEEQELLLVKNPNYSGAANGPESIELVELPNDETLRDSLKIGMISCLFDDLSDGEALNLSEKGQTVEIGNLVFLGANNKEGLCADEAVRKAISAAVDREMLVDRVYASKAKAAELPFHPDYYKTSKYEAKKLTTDEARNLLENSGLTKNAAGYYGNEEQSVLKLLYNSENAYRQQMAEMLKQQLANLGLELELQGLPYEEYMAMLKAGNFDLYIGELAIDDSMDIRRLIQPGNGYGYGNMAENSLLSVYNSYQQGNVSVELFLSVYEQNMPAIPLLYRQGLIVCNEQLQEVFSPQPDRAFAEVCLQ